MFKHKEHSLNIGIKTYKFIEVSNFEDLYDALLLKESEGEATIEDHIPYWTDLWPSAIGLSEYLVDNANIILGQKVIEIGCGLGLPSIVAAHMQPSLLVTTDLLSDAVEYAKKNAAINDVEHLMLFQTCDWPKELSNCGGNYDVVIAADIIYESRFVQKFVDQIGLLQSQGAKITILLAEPSRNVAVGMLKQITVLPTVGVSTSLKTITWNNLETQVKIHQITVNL